MSHLPWLFYAPSGPNLTGGAKTFLQLLERLDPARFCPICVAARQSPLTDRLQQLGYKTLIVPFPPILDVYNEGVFAYSLKDKLSSLRAVLDYNARIAAIGQQHQVRGIWGRNVKSILLIGLAARQLRVPLVWDIGMEKESRGLMKLLHWIGLNLATVIVTQAAAQPQAIFGSQARRFAAKFVTIPPGIDWTADRIIDQTVNQDMNQITDRAINRTAHQAANQAANRKINSRMDRIVAEPVDHRIDYPTDHKTIVTGSADVATAVQDAAPENQPAAPFNILMVGTVTPRKNQLLLLRAVSDLISIHPQIHVRIVGPIGDETYSSTCREFVQQAGLAQQVTFCGWREDVPDLMRQSQILVLCSNNEGLPHVLREAMQAGLTPIATAVGGIPDAIEPGQTGLLIEPDDVDGLQAAIEYCLTHPEERLRIGQQARQAAIDQFSLSRWSDQYHSLLQHLCPIA